MARKKKNDPFVCSICKKRFTSTYNRNRHKKSTIAHLKQ